MKPFIRNSKNNFIAGWYIDTLLCKSIVNRIEQNSHLLLSGIKDYTNCDLIDVDKDLHDKYCQNLYQVIEEYKKLYPLCYRTMQMWGWTTPRIQRYEPGKAYSELHCENNGQGLYLNRHLAYMTYVNSVDEGGGTEFPLQQMITPAEQGLTLIWPAGWTHHHKGVVAPKEVKYIVTGWLCFYPDATS